MAHPMAILVSILQCLLTLDSPVFAAAAPPGFLELSKLSEIQGEYHGEVRLQSQDGRVNRSVVTDAKLALRISGDEILLESSSDLAGKGCQSKIGAIRELLTYPAGDSHVLKAEFEFKPAHCAARMKYDSILVLLGKERSGELVMETLFVKAAVDHEIQHRLASPMNVHGYFTREKPASP